MSLDKGVRHGKEKRKKYRGAKAVDPECRNNGSCDYCKGNRQHKNRKREMTADELLRDYKEGLID